MMWTQLMQPWVQKSRMTILPRRSPLIDSGRLTLNQS